MAYLDIYQLRYDAINLRKKTAVAISVAAVAILGEDPATPLHSARLKWATDALADTGTMTEKVLWSVIMDPTVQSEGDNATDSHVQTAVDNSVNLFAREYL